MTEAQNIRCDLLVDDIEVSGGVLLVLALADTVDLVVDGSTVVVTHLTSTGNSPLDVGRMPCTNTSDLSQTLVCLSGQLLGSPSAGDTLETVTLGDGNGINHLILLEDGIDLNWLLKQTMAEVDLVRNATTVDLDLHQVCLLLLERCRADLCVGKDTDDSAVFLDALQFTSNRSTLVVGVLLGVLGESLLLRSVPVLVESSSQLVAKMFCPDRREGSEAARSFDVTDKTDNDHLVKVSLHHL